MWNVEITVTENYVMQSECSNDELLYKFLSAKKVEGCSEKTIKYYQATLRKMLEKMVIHVTHMTTDHIREYLSEYQKIMTAAKEILIISAGFYQVFSHGWKKKTIL